MFRKLKPQDHITVHMCVGRTLLTETGMFVEQDATFITIRRPDNKMGSYVHVHILKDHIYAVTISIA